MNLGAWPTALEPAPGLAAATGVGALWLKREDRASPRYGGSKVRGLEFLFARMAPGTCCVTVGGTGSTHCLATAVHAAACGSTAVLAQFPQPDTEWARAVGRAAARHAAAVRRASSRIAFPLAVARAWRLAGTLGPRRWIPAGGAHPLAVLGHLVAVTELEEQLHPPPDAIILPLGSGGTAAGVVLGVAALGWRARVVAVRVVPWVVANRWRVMWLARAARAAAARRGIALPAPGGRSLDIVDGLGPGYGHPTPDGEAARRLAATHGLVLDSTYGGKAFAWLARAGHGERLVFWNTFAPPPAEVDA